MAYILSCSSTADMPESFFTTRDVHYICFHYQLNGVDLPDDLGKSTPFDVFYQAMRDGASTSTSQISVGEYQEYFEGFLRDGKDILHLSLSSGISGTVQSAQIAAEELRPKYPERTIYVMDSLTASAGYGLFMDMLADLRDKGRTIDEAYEWAMANRQHFHHWFYTDELKYLVRGGRVSKASGFVGGMLNICPLMRVDHEGKLVSFQKLRGHARAEAAAVEQVALHIQNGTEHDGRIVIGHADCMDRAESLKALIEAKFPKLKEIIITSIGTTIGSHTGPGLVVVAFYGDEREVR